ncbi:hypothetical protein HY989_00790 [Candidatus Micrarchaeota archaeon]|nr:hypothetical protein [Candidatus Micrarchaeota archaeon]
MASILQLLKTQGYSRLANLDELIALKQKGATGKYYVAGEPIRFSNTGKLPPLPHPPNILFSPDILAVHLKENGMALAKIIEQKRSGVGSAIRYLGMPHFETMKQHLKKLGFELHSVWIMREKHQDATYSPDGKLINNVKFSHFE